MSLPQGMAVMYQHRTKIRLPGYVQRPIFAEERIETEVLSEPYERGILRCYTIVVLETFEMQYQHRGHKREVKVAVCLHPGTSTRLAFTYVRIPPGELLPLDMLLQCPFNCRNTM